MHMVFDSAVLPLGIYPQEIMMDIFKDFAVRKFIIQKEKKRENNLNVQ